MDESTLSSYLPSDKTRANYVQARRLHYVINSTSQSKLINLRPATMDGQLGQDLLPSSMWKEKEQFNPFELDPPDLVPPSKIFEENT